MLPIIERRSLRLCRCLACVILWAVGASACVSLKPLPRVRLCATFRHGSRYNYVLVCVFHDTNTALARTPYASLQLGSSSVTLCRCDVRPPPLVQDAHICLMFAVFDGHGGDATAKAAYVSLIACLQFAALPLPHPPLAGRVLPCGKLLRTFVVRSKFAYAHG